MASGKNGHLAENDTPGGVDEESLRTLKAPRRRKLESEDGLGAEELTFKVEFAAPEPSSNRGSSIGMMLALTVLLLAVCYLIFILSRNNPVPSTVADTSGASQTERTTDSFGGVSGNAPNGIEVAPVPADLEKADTGAMGVAGNALDGSLPKDRLELATLESQLDPLDSLLEYDQFGDSVRYLFRLERRFPNDSSPLKEELRAVLAAWLESSKAPNVHDQEIIAILAERGFEDESMALVFRGADEMPEDAVWMRAAAERGHVDSMLRLAGRHYDRDQNSPDAELWYRRAAVSGSQEAIEWCSQKGITL